ncbi:hypothetical protein PAMP_013195 [Pampus punctatissimus]
MNEGRVRVVCVSLFIVFFCPPPSLLSVSPSAPGVCVADKTGEEEEEEEAGSRYGAVCLGCLPRQARDQVKGPRCGAPTAPPCLCLPNSPPPPAGGLFVGMRQRACWAWLGSG